MTGRSHDGRLPRAGRHRQRDRRTALAAFAFFVPIMAGMCWFFTTSTYQLCSSAIGALNSRFAVETSTHSASGWVTLMAIAAGRSSWAAVLARGSATLCLTPVLSSRAGFLAGVARKPQPVSPGWQP
jgi:hypothetical protein